MPPGKMKMRDLRYPLTPGRVSVVAIKFTALIWDGLSVPVQPQFLCSLLFSFLVMRLYFRGGTSPIPAPRPECHPPTYIIIESPINGAHCSDLMPHRSRPTPNLKFLLSTKFRSCSCGMPHLSLRRFNHASSKIRKWDIKATPGSDRCPDNYGTDAIASPVQSK